MVDVRSQEGGAVMGVLATVCLLLPGALSVPQEHPRLPVLFSFTQPSHTVAVFRGADLQRPSPPVAARALELTLVLVEVAE